MDTVAVRSYLLFSLNGTRYGVEAMSVQEITWLPELTPAEEAPSYIAGVLNRRGKIEPVMNLALRLGHPPQRYRTSDSVVSLQADGVTIGMIVNEVSNVIGIAAAEIQPPPHYDDASPGHMRFLAGDVTVGEEIVMLLDVQRLIHAPALPECAAATGTQARFFPDVTEEERTVFRARAHNLMLAETSLEVAERVALSIVQLGEECFGVGLDVVREFAHLRRVTPIPCCPPHIAGNMNLRGDILTLLDIRGLLNIPAGGAAEVMVIESGELSIGVPVDKVLEVIYLQATDIASLPAAAHEEKQEYCKGVVRYSAGMVSVLDMRKILAQGGLDVNEEV